jgi:KUP system potassium uptake protein
MPVVNWVLAAGAIALVLAFRSSDNLAAAYGVAVNSTMAITTILAFNVARERGGWSLREACAFLIGFLAIDLGFLGSNLLKIPDGGWLPIAIGIVLFVLMTTWHRGSELLAEQVAGETVPVETLIGRLSNNPVIRVPGTAVFFTGRLEQTPPALLQLLRHTGIAHHRIVLVTVVIEQVPHVGKEERLELSALDQGLYRVILRFGFMQGPNVPSDLKRCAEHGLNLDLGEVRYFVGQVDMLAGRKQQGMARLFAWMARNTEDATAPYHIPAGQAMSVGLRVGI